jgi:hypothetical protein
VPVGVVVELGKRAEQDVDRVENAVTVGGPAVGDGVRKGARPTT